MAYSASDYPQVKRASESYDVAKAARLKAQRLFDETSTKSPKYEEVKSALAAAKKQEEARLTTYKSTNEAAKADYNRKTISVKATADTKSAEAAIKSLDEQLKKAEDSGQSTTKIKADKAAAERKLADAAAAKKRATSQGAPVTPARTADQARTQAASGQTQAPITRESGTPTVTPGVVKTPQTPNPKPGTPKPKPGTPAPTAADREAGALGVASTATDLALPETLFKNIPSLNAILKKYVSTPGMTEAAFLKLIRDDVWFKQNSKEIKNRYVQYYNYRDLQASGQTQGTTAYEMEIAKIEAKLKKRAVEMGSAAASDPAALRQAAENLYITNRSDDESFITDFLAASVKTIAGIIGGKVTQGYSGEALANYDKLVEAARDNGFQVSDILPGAATEQQVIQGIISGNIDVNRVISDARKLAAQGQPQYVRDLLSQGYNLKQVFAPYRQVMANVLEVGDPNQIDLNDPLLRSAITDKGDMNLYDFKKQLRRDNRWQYTEQAKADVSTAALNVLRDFGFQG